MSLNDFFARLDAEKATHPLPSSQENSPPKVSSLRMQPGVYGDPEYGTRWSEQRAPSSQETPDGDVTLDDMVNAKNGDIVGGEWDDKYEPMTLEEFAVKVLGFELTPTQKLILQRQLELPIIRHASIPKTLFIADEYEELDLIATENLKNWCKQAVSVQFTSPNLFADQPTIVSK